MRGLAICVGAVWIVQHQHHCVGADGMQSVPRNTAGLPEGAFERRM